METKMTRFRLGLSTALILIAPAVSAQQAPEQSRMAIARACAGDIERLCPGVPPGEGRIKACMKAHISQVSAPCFDALLGAIAAGKE
jgi:hypothetical protein